MLIAGGSLLGLVTVFALWRQVPLVASLVVLAGCGVVVGAGALLVQDEASAAEWVLTLATVGVLTPLHAKLVFGRRRRSS